MRCVIMTVYGRVQGVGYRYFCQRVAKSIGLTGYVKNMPSGEVETGVCGQTKQIEDYYQQLLQGPPFAEVKRIEVQEAEDRHYDCFKVLY